MCTRLDILLRLQKPLPNCTETLLKLFTNNVKVRGAGGEEVVGKVVGLYCRPLCSVLCLLLFSTTTTASSRFTYYALGARGVRGEETLLYTKCIGESRVLNHDAQR